MHPASQMWLLGRILPLVIGNLLPPEDGEEFKNWDNFLTLMKIVDILFAPTTTTELLEYLARRIEGHHITFQELYPNNSVIPKMHFMVHMPHLMNE